MLISDWSDDTSGLGQGWVTYTATSRNETEGPWVTKNEVIINISDDWLLDLLDTGLPWIGGNQSPIWEFTASSFPEQLNYQVTINAHLAENYNFLEYFVVYAYQV